MGVGGGRSPRQPASVSFSLPFHCIVFSVSRVLAPFHGQYSFWFACCCSVVDAWRVAAAAAA